MGISVLLPILAQHAEKLTYFYEVSLSGSLNASARKMAISAPTISYAIKQLELVINTKLFERSKEGMKLTLAGEHLRTFCERHYREMEDLEALLKKPAGNQVTRLRIGTFQSIAIYFWPYMMEILKDEPSLSMSIKTDRSSSIIDSLIKKEIDMAITVEGKQTPELIRHELYKDEYSAYTSIDEPGSKLSKEQAKDRTMMYIPDAEDYEGVSLRRHLYTTDLHFKEIFEIDSFEVIAEFASRNYGIGILPRKVAIKHQDRIKEIKIEGMPKKRFGTHRFFLSYRKDLEISQILMSLVLDAAYQAVQNL